MIALTNDIVSIIYNILTCISITYYSYLYKYFPSTDVHCLLQCVYRSEHVLLLYRFENKKLQHQKSCRGLWAKYLRGEWRSVRKRWNGKCSEISHPMGRHRRASFWQILRSSSDRIFVDHFRVDDWNSANVRSAFDRSFGKRILISFQFHDPN